MARKPRLRATTGTKKAGAFAALTLVEDELTPSLKVMRTEMPRIIQTTFRFYEPQVVNYMRLNAPWNDQTGNARQGLAAKSGRSGDTFWLVAFHQVPYGIFLEVRWGGKYAIIMPTLNLYGDKILASLNGILEKRFHA